MFAICPKCQNTQTISAEQLQKKRGKVICSQCQHLFNPRTSLTDTPSKSNNKAEEETYAWQTPKKSHSKIWALSSLIAIAALLYQVYYFKGYSLSQSAQFRPLLETVSNTLNQTLPPYRNRAEFSTIGSSFKMTEDGSYRLQVSFINHANFSQPLPSLTLTLQNLQGGLVTQRHFTAKDYTTNQRQAFIASQANFDIDLLVTVPNINFAGYHIELN